MADRTYQSRQARFGRDRDPEYSRQQEQFENGSSWRDDERAPRQMGEGWDRDDDSYYRATYGPDRTHLVSEHGADRGTPYSTGGVGRAHYDNRETRGFASFTGSDFGGRDFSGPRYNYGAGRAPWSASGPYGAGGYYGEGSYGAAPRRDYGGRSERGWLERTGDEIASWFGDEEAARRREQDHRGKGPAGYTRSDERIREDVNDSLTEDWRVDARAIEIEVGNGEVTLNGTVPSRMQKRRAEDLVEDLSGVKHVQNNLRVRESTAWNRDNDETGSR